ncbi:MAG: phage tail tape measure protein [Proteobacteria bacterium]|nr:phage tail tape measure protein [Pseudomonadota bacterium]
MAGRFSVEAVFKAVDRVTAPVTRMQNRVTKFTRSMQRSFTKLNRVVRRMGDGLKKGVAVGTASLVALGAAMGNVIGVGAEFGRAIGSAAAKFPEKIQRGTKEFKELEATARRVGATTEFTATQAAQGLNFLAKAGFDAKFSMQALPDIVDFATASEMDFAEAADIASDAIGAFGLDSSDAAKRMVGLRRTMDVMSKTANSTNVSVASYSSRLKKVPRSQLKPGNLSKHLPPLPVR